MLHGALGAAFASRRHASGSQPPHGPHDITHRSPGRPPRPAPGRRAPPRPRSRARRPRREVAARERRGGPARVALARAAVAAAARRAHRDPVAGGQRIALALRAVRAARRACRPGHLDRRSAAGSWPPQQAGRADAAVVHQERRSRLAAQQPDAVARRRSRRACLPGAARALAQRVLLEQDRVVLLQHLDRLRLRDADRGAAVGQPVVSQLAAVAAAAEDVHDVVALRSAGRSRRA